MLTLNVDDKIVDNLKKRIIIQENSNLKTGIKTDSQMIAWIKKEIEEKVQ